jgi:hypothetical protein
MTCRELRRLLVDYGCKYLRDARGWDHEIWLMLGRKLITECRAEEQSEFRHNVPK